MTHAGHIRVALTTNSLTEVDADFATAKQILFYDVSAEAATFMDAAQFDGRPMGTRGPGGGSGCSNSDPLDGGSAEAMSARFAALDGCGVLFTRRLTDFAAVRIHAGQTFPVKMDIKRDVADVLEQLRLLISTNPPRWLRRKLGMNDADRSLQDCCNPIESVAG